MRGPRPGEPEDGAPEPSRSPARPGELFIVDNADSEWKVARYLREWCEIARAFDIATGYFEIGALLDLDGQWQKLERIRILMGDEVSLRTRQAFEAAVSRVAAVLDASLESEKEKNDFLAGVPAIVAALADGRIACRVYKERKFHAKACITHARFAVMPSFALVGSSNFTHPGLHDNVELNLQIPYGVETLQAWYEKHWAEAEEVTPEILRTLERHTREYSPFEVYAKALYEFFKGHEITETEWERAQSRMYPVLDEYQRQGYRALLKIAAQHSGALLCDSVGLGKTFIGLMLIERLVERERKRVALIVPKAAREAVWEAKLRRFLPGLLRVGFGSDLVIYNHSDLLRGGDFPARMDEVREKADVVIVDEAHHFRNQAAKGHRKLFDLLEGKQVYLLTATPVNNTLLDLQHLIELFSRRKPDHFKNTLGVHSLPGHFRGLENALKKIVGERGADVELSMAEAERVLANDDLFRKLVVQRSRAYARKSQEQTGGTRVVFPRRERPNVADYSLAKTYGRLLDRLERAFSKDKPLLSLAVYYPLGYPVRQKDETQEESFARGRQAQVVGLIRTQLLKRFESSAVAFRATCERLLLRLLAFVERNAVSPAERRRLERWRAQHAELLERIRERRNESAEDEDEDVIPAEFLEAAEELSRAEFRVDEMLDETFLDLDELAGFLDLLADFSPERDDKLRALAGLLKTDPHLKRHKVLIFSEYMETARYLAAELKRAGVGPLEEVDSGSDRDRGEIIAAFSPYYNESSSPALAEAGRTETRVLISTDVLSEGLNLQDASLLVNYDLHWNPVRLMQRIGRVDRRLDPEVERQMLADHPDWKAARGTVRYWNFLPPEELDRLLSLYARVAHKTLRISKTLGIESRKLLRPEDEYEPLREFDHAYEGEPSSIEQMALNYGVLLKAYPGLEAKLAGFPSRVFSGREHPRAGARGVFFCYSLPAKNTATGEWDEAAGLTRWYLFDLASERILEDAEAIDALIRSEPDTPRRHALEKAALRELRGKVEKRIRDTYLKSVQAPQGVRPALKAWMELN